MEITTKNFENHFQKLMVTLPKWSKEEYDVTKLEQIPVIICFLQFKEKFLLLKRSEKVSSGNGLWSTIAGHYDELKSVEEIFEKELKEELKVGINLVKELEKGRISIVEADGKIFVAQLLLAKLKEKIIPKLDFEHTEFGWFTLEEIENLNTYPKFRENLKSFLIS